MSKVPTHSNPHCLSPSQVEGHLLKAGIQPTAQRIAICRYVLCEANHPTADDVKAWADKNFPKLSLATVYNTLGILVKAGLLREYRFGDSERVIYDNNLSNHHHFLDEKTGKVFDIDEHDIEIVSKFKKPFRVLGFDVVVRGRIE